MGAASKTHTMALKVVFSELTGQSGSMVVSGTALLSDYYDLGNCYGQSG
jgi:hypothetical protein